MKEILLSQMKIGQMGRIRDVLGESPVSQRLLEMGVTSGSHVEMIRFAPLGDPLDIKIRGYHLTLRRKEAEMVRVFLLKKEEV
ncbi:MAG TPA: hypothetical protein DD723_07275 [Candidatus Omnitrophica bacterium]|nr:MAG: hypothetical protein A2Z81_09185 [Omnitrophica WOR_2 bacterium GWA2_45_18]OGX20630.1 MAG: hypothetical protein A2Y04_05925 [Omnitrophica WOR_2 bacterium GWC2_45_7]HBR15326.1 hypothetical protein [Candidatus Omnitrophota bacterium]